MMKHGEGTIVESLILVILMELHFVLSLHCWLNERAIYDYFQRAKNSNNYFVRLHRKREKLQAPSCADILSDARLDIFQHFHQLLVHPLLELHALLAQDKRARVSGLAVVHVPTMRLPTSCRSSHQSS